MDFNNFDNNNFSSREKLEIGESGKSLGDERKEKKREKELKGRGRRGSGMRGRRGDKTELSFKLLGTIAFWVFMVFVLFALNARFDWVSLDFNQKMSMEEGYTSFVNSTKDVHNDAGVNSGMVEERDEIYQNNAVYDGSGVMQLQDDVYLLYVYTLDRDKDELFNLFVESYGSDVPVYTALTDEVTQDVGYNTLDENTNRTLEDPHFIMYEHVNGGENIPLKLYYEEDLENVIRDFNENYLRHQDEEEGYR